MGKARLGAEGQRDEGTQGPQLVVVGGTICSGWLHCGLWIADCGLNRDATKNEPEGLERNSPRAPPRELESPAPLLSPLFSSPGRGDGRRCGNGQDGTDLNAKNAKGVLEKGRFMPSAGRRFAGERGRRRYQFKRRRVCNISIG
jgi:hypothetical protein